MKEGDKILISPELTHHDGWDGGVLIDNFV